MRIIINKLVKNILYMLKSINFDITGSNISIKNVKNSSIKITTTDKDGKQVIEIKQL